MSEEIAGITTPYVIYIIKHIKRIQERLKKPDLKNASFAIAANTLEKEFGEFAEKYPGIYYKIIRGEDMAIIASNLYYMDRVARGLDTVDNVADNLAKKYLPPDLKRDSDMKIKEMREKGEI